MFTEGPELFREHRHAGSIEGYSFSVTFVAKEEQVSNYIAHVQFNLYKPFNPCTSEHPEMHITVAL